MHLLACVEQFIDGLVKSRLDSVSLLDGFGRPRATLAGVARLQSGAVGGETGVNGGEGGKLFVDSQRPRRGVDRGGVVWYNGWEHVSYPIS